MTELPRRRRGLGVAALVLGVAALLTLPLCGMGVLAAVAGLIVGGIAVSRDNGRGLAVGGLAMSAAALIAAITVGAWFYGRIAPCADTSRYRTEQAREACLQQRVPFFRATPRALP